MPRRFVTFAVVLSVAGCGNVVDEQRSTINVDGKTYPLVTQTVESGGRAYEVSYVIVKNERRQCIPESPGDCAAAARESRRSGER